MSELGIALIGAGIALVGVIIGGVLQHFLSLRADRIKRERDKEEEKRLERKRELLRGSELGGATLEATRNLAELKDILLHLEGSTRFLAGYV